MLEGRLGKTSRLWSRSKIIQKNPRAQCTSLPPKLITSLTKKSCLLSAHAPLKSIHLAKIRGLKIVQKGEPLGGQGVESLRRRGASALFPKSAPVLCCRQFYRGWSVPPQFKNQSELIFLPFSCLMWKKANSKFFEILDCYPLTSLTLAEVFAQIFISFHNNFLENPLKKVILNQLSSLPKQQMMLRF